MRQSLVSPIGGSPLCHSIYKPIKSNRSSRRFTACPTSSRTLWVLTKLPLHNRPLLSFLTISTRRAWPDVTDLDTGVRLTFLDVKLNCHSSVDNRTNPNLRFVQCPGTSTLAQSADPGGGECLLCARKHRESCPPDRVWQTREDRDGGVGGGYDHYSNRSPARPGRIESHLWPASFIGAALGYIHSARRNFPIRLPPRESGASTWKGLEGCGSHLNRPSRGGYSE